MLFRSKLLRVAPGSLIIQKHYDYADREPVEQLTENPYSRYFIGLPGYQQEPPFVPSLPVEFRKRLTVDILVEINEMIIEFNNHDDTPPSGGESSSPDEPAERAETTENIGTLMLDATCAPQNIAFPQDITCRMNSRKSRDNHRHDLL